MKTKALLLGAKPLPFRGPRVSISEAERWRASVNSDPVDVELNGDIYVEIEVDGVLSTVPFVHGMELSGDFATAILGREQKDCNNISIILEAF